MLPYTLISRRALVLPRVSWLQILLPARESSGAAMCATALNPASLLWRALTLPCVPRLFVDRGP
jgi:hypothetical protein